MTMPGSTNVYGRTIPDTFKAKSGYMFKIGHIERVFNDEVDYINYNGSKNIKHQVHNYSQLVSFFDLTHREKKNAKTAFAQPLLRGINDSITHGDLILWTTIGGINFYLGPLNPRNDPMFAASHIRSNKTVGNQIASDDRGVGKNGYSKNVPTMAIKKASKPTNKNIDDPLDKFVGDGGLVDYQSRMSDLVLEGRYNNHIRIGNRSIAPLISINNGVGESQSTEGSLIMMTSLGSIDDHLITLDPDAEEDGKFYSNFQLACDKEFINSDDYVKGWNLAFGNDKKGIENREQNKFDSKYGPNFSSLSDEEKEEFKSNPDADKSHQIFITSERIIFDARDDDYIASSKRNINFGAGNNLTITTKGFSVIQSKNIYLGKEAKKRTEPMVLGNKLNEVLIQIMELIQKSHALVQGVPLPLVDSAGNAASIQTDIKEIMDNLKNAYNTNADIEDDKNPIPIGDASTGGPSFFSKYHYIEPNLENRNRTTQE